MNIFESHGLTLSPEQLNQFEKLCDLFLDWNSKINLSAIRDREGVYEKHFVDSLLATKHIDFEHKKILDLGAGGGFPCLPLSIVTSHSRTTALDSVGKKMKVVQLMADELKLKLKAVHGRIEDFGHDPNFREQFDMVTARALAPWPTLLEYALPFVKIGGLFVAYQGPAIRDDLKQFKDVEILLGGEIIQVFEDSLESKNDRIFIVIKKIKQCSHKFPRKMGEPKKNPIFLNKIFDET